MAARAVILAAALTIACEPASASDYAAFRAARPVTIRGYDGDAMEPFITRDGRLMLFNSRNDPPDKTRLLCARRIDDVTFEFVGEIAGANAPGALSAVPSLTSDGVLFFVTTRSYERDRSTIYTGAFAGCAVAGVRPAPGVGPAMPGIVTFDAEISGDGRTLYLVDGDYRGAGPKPRTAHIVIATRQPNGAFLRSPESERLLAAVNAAGLDYAPSESADGKELFFTRVDTIGPGATPQIWRASRASVSEPFGAPARVTAADGFVEAPSLSADGARLYFHKQVGGRFRIFEAER